MSPRTRTATPLPAALCLIFTRSLSLSNHPHDTSLRPQLVAAQELKKQEVEVERMIEQFKITQRLERQKQEDEAARQEVVKNQELSEYLTRPSQCLPIHESHIGSATPTPPTHS